LFGCALRAITLIELFSAPNPMVHTRSVLDRNMPDDAVRHATARVAPTNPAAGTAAMSMATVRHVIEVPALRGGSDVSNEKLSNTQMCERVRRSDGQIVR
jgi:hypothetical protein